MDILHLIVARGGSKGIPGKNLRTVNGLSLVGYKARSARRSVHCTRLVISTDCPAIQEEARRHGVEVPFTRPDHLATDTAPTNAVLAHAIDWFETTENRRYDAVMLLEPSSPFATAADYDRAVDLFRDRGAALVVGMRRVAANPAFCHAMGPDASIGPIVARINERTRLRRQDLAPEYTMNGALYLIGWDDFKASGRIYADETRSYGLIMDDFHSVEIDEPVDLAFADFLVRENWIDRAHWN